MQRLVLLVACLCAAADAAHADVDRAQLRADLAAARSAHLKVFHTYRRARVYPHNSYEPGMLNVWRDQDGHLCAVATMVDRDGQDAIVNQIADGDNFVKVADLKDGPLTDWMLTSGFTQEELAMIQWPTWAQDDPVGYAKAMREQRARERAVAREDRRLAAGYYATEHTLKDKRVEEAGLDVAVARLATRPELAAALHARLAK